MGGSCQLGFPVTGSQSPLPHPHDRSQCPVPCLEPHRPVDLPPAPLATVPTSSWSELSALRPGCLATPVKAESPTPANAQPPAPVPPQLHTHLLSQRQAAPLGVSVHLLHDPASPNPSGAESQVASSETPHDQQGWDGTHSLKATPHVTLVAAPVTPCPAMRVTLLL